MNGRKRVEFLNELRLVSVFQVCAAYNYADLMYLSVSAASGTEIFNVGRLYKLTSELKNWSDFRQLATTHEAIFVHLALNFLISYVRFG